MTGRERIMATLSGQPADRPCWAPLIDRYFLSSLRDPGQPDPEVADVARRVDADVIERHVPAVRLVDRDGLTRRLERDGETEIELVETPAGTLRCERRRSDKPRTTFVQRHPIATVEDVKIYRSVLERTGVEEDVDPFVRQEQIIGDDGIATCSGPITPLQQFLQHLCGVERTIYLLADHPEEMEACFAAMHQHNLEVYARLCNTPARVIIAYEDTSSTVFGPNYYAEYCAPLIDRYADLCHDAGKIYLTHMCGRLSVFKDQIRAGRQDGIDSVCPPTTGDTPAHEAREAWGEDKVIIGGIEPPALARMSRDQAADCAARVLDDMGSFSRFILSTGDATPYDAPLENLEAISEVVRSRDWRA
jgi:uroporphyrinogen-III decarboxylase